MKWNELSLKEKAELMKLYVSNGITKLDDIITHYNAYQEGGKITFEQWKQQMQQLYPDIEMDNNRAGYDYNAYFNNNYNAAIAQLTNLQHFPDTYKLPNHKTFSNESIYSRSPMMGGNWINDSTFYPSIINRQQYPDIYKEDRPYTEREIYGNEYQLGGILNKIRSYFAPTYGGSFNQAYATAVKNNDEYFKWNGNRYNTKDSGIKRKPSQTMPDYSQLPFKEAYKKASKELPVKGEFGWNGAVYSANNAMENTDLTKIPVYKLWETVTGQPWSKAKEWGFTDGLAKTNIGLRKALLQVAKQRRKIENATPVEILRVLKNGYISTDIDNGFNVPLNETPITIKDSKAGKNQGTVFFPTVLDSLAVHGFNTNTSPVITFGLPAQESAMSPLYGHQTTDAEDFNNFAVGQMFSAWNVKTTPLDDLWKYVSDAKNDSEANMTIKNGAPYSFKKYADYILPSNIIDWSYNKFKSGTYNTGDKNHTRDVIKRGTDFLQANEVQNWFYNHWLPEQSNQQEWIDWWNNYQQGGSLGTVIPLHKYQSGSSLAYQNEVVDNWMHNWYNNRVPVAMRNMMDYEGAVAEPKDLFKNLRITQDLLNNALYNTRKIPTTYAPLPPNLNGVYRDDRGDILLQYGAADDVLIHEKSHALHDFLGNRWEENGRVMQDAPFWVAIGEVTSDDLYEDENGKYIYDEYLDDVNEIYSRLMQIRYNNNLDPRHHYTIKEIQDLRRKGKLNLPKSDGLERYTDKFIQHLFNEVADSSVNNTLSNIAAKGGKLGKITPLGQWQYPHQVTTIPSNNITMKGVDYPVLGISDTGDTKYMLPNMDYLFDGNYVTEYPLHKFQKGGYTTNGITLADGRTLYPISDLPADDNRPLPYGLPAAKIN